MEVKNPDAQLAMYMNSLSKVELRDLMVHCRNIIKKHQNTNNEIKKNQQTKKCRSICEILFDY